ncbi:FecR family protein [Chitinophaga agri]|uniref:DUF4974 domain-containing protein n=1 Tax=Chitinophaga agri TaxID=2703787 RepID=A0A6B9ZJ12_9BACT|nr:FecR domain-containing protein [Chitinophaga agri]QHS61075.1 DUF4974 domain-containing protein [Chitinophaga agri]
MPVDPQYIEQLILQEILGNISPEDSITLKKILISDPHAQAMWQTIHERLAGIDIPSLQEDLPNTLPAAQIIAVARRRKRRKIMMTTTTSVAVILLLITVVYKILLPAFQPVSPAHIPLYALKTVVLQLPDGEIVHLGSGQQQLKAGGRTFREVDGKLSWSGGGTESQLATIIIPPGKDYIVQLSDGTAVTLNAATRMEFPLTFNGNRAIRINGEAYLQVARQDGIPFSVQLPNSTVQVLGTSFNVNTYDHTREQVLLESGAVKVVTRDGTLQLTPGEAAEYQPGTRPLAMAIDTAAALSWKHGYYSFTATPVKTVSKTIERNYRIRVILDSDITANRTLTTRLEKAEPLPELLRRLRKIDNIHYQFENGDSVLHLLYRP